MLPFPNPMLVGSNLLNADQVFATNLYTGNNQSRQIINNLNNLSSGGLVWLKSRSQSNDHLVYDHTKSSGLIVSSSDPAFGSTYVTMANNGYTVSADNLVAANGANYVVWNFRRSRKFFDIVTYTGNNISGRQIAHKLGIKPGVIIVKCISSTGNWRVYHNAIGATKTLVLNVTDPAGTTSQVWANTEPTADFFTVGSSSGEVNTADRQYVAYLFAHDPSPTGIIQCGSYTGNGNNIGTVVNLGWEPQWLLIKRTDNGASTNWLILDNKRSPSNPKFLGLYPNLQSAESNSGNTVSVDFLSSGFQLRSSGAIINTNGGTYSYMAIRKGRL